MYFTGWKRFWKYLEMWKFWSFLKTPKIHQSAKLCRGVWKSEIFPQTQNIIQVKETDHLVPRFSLLFIRPGYITFSLHIYGIYHIFLAAWNRKTSRISKTFLRKIVARKRVVFWNISLPSGKIIHNVAQINYSAIPLWNSCVVKSCMFPKHHNTVK